VAQSRRASSAARPRPKKGAAAPAKKAAAKPKTAAKPGSGGGELSPLRITAVVAVALAVALVVFLLVRGGDDDDGGAAADPTDAAETSVADLEQLAGDLDYPVYWAGERDDTKLELTITEEGNVSVRYVASGAEIGTRESPFLTISTYPFEGGHGALLRASKAPGAETIPAKSGALIVIQADNPESAYFSFPGQDYQVEVYDPKPGRALEIVSSGDVQPVD
jgi:hypothetical protein